MKNINTGVGLEGLLVTATKRGMSRSHGLQEDSKGMKAATKTK